METFQFRLREFPDLLPWRQSPFSAETEQKSNQWVRNHLGGLFPDAAQLEEFIDCRLALWPCLAYPDASPERLLAICNWNQLWFRLDDLATYDPQLSTSKESARKAYVHLKNALCHTTDSDYLPARLATMAWQAFSGLSNSQRTRFVGAYGDMLDGFMSEVTYRSGASECDFDTCMDIHRVSGGMTWTLVHLEYGLGIDVSTQMKSHPELEEISRPAIDHTLLTNAILAFRKEYFTGDPMNPVACLIRSRGWDIQRSVDHVQELILDLEKEFIARRDRILAGELGQDPEVCSYLDAVGRWMKGTLRWQFISPRYHGRGWEWNGLTSGWVTITPQRTVITPSPQIGPVSLP
ncbi:terpene synthase family protein [Streptomyces sp. Pv4-95]|uniref:terpene synthase family protein n=1 Tax=Streptomyces sp. Pv4-95 TaxID=3049543 RepID=UPI00389217DC